MSKGSLAPIAPQAERGCAGMMRGKTLPTRLMTGVINTRGCVWPPFVRSFVPSFLPSVLPSALPPFLASFLPQVRPFVLPSVLPSASASPSPLPHCWCPRTTDPRLRPPREWLAEKKEVHEKKHGTGSFDARYGANDGPSALAPATEEVVPDAPITLLHSEATGTTYRVTALVHTVTRIMRSMHASQQLVEFAYASVNLYLYAHLMHDA
jgi:hypothetical protein